MSDDFRDVFVNVLCSSAQSWRIFGGINLFVLLVSLLLAILVQQRSSFVVVTLTIVVSTAGVLLAAGVLSLCAAEADREL